ncbi:MAG TPA: hypothetical protein VHT50_32595 [Mycobacterium sp.]|nr:hypothetical protein [Mycobacterium sp.]
MELAVRRQMSGTAWRRNLLTDEAMAVHAERLESLFAAALRQGCHRQRARG